jgi:hypothetical protein
MGRRSDGTKRIKNITWHTVRVEYDTTTGKGAKNFETVHELATFLKDNPEFTARVGYVAKKYLSCVIK